MTRAVIKLIRDFRPAPQYREFYVITVDGIRAGKLYVKSRGRKLFMSISVNVAQQGKGVGKESVRQFMRKTNMRTLYGITRKSNLAMNRIFRKLKWRLTGGTRQNVYRWRKP